MAPPPSDEQRDRRRPLNASLAHGLAVLEALSQDRPEMGLTELAKRVGLSKPTTWRLVHTLVRLGYLRQDLDTKRFRLSPRILSLGTLFEGMDLKDLAAPFLRDLSALLGETVNMAVQDGDHILYIERVKTSQVVNINLHVGSRLPLYNTSMGRALVAYMPGTWISEYLARLSGDPHARRYVEEEGRVLREALQQTRARGYALNDEDLVAGLRSVAAPIWRAGAALPVAAVNVAVPSARVSTRQLHERYAPELISTAAHISTALGWRRQPPTSISARH
jgi:IclR family pca regulon transcriptional regulator